MIEDNLFCPKCKSKQIIPNVFIGRPTTVKLYCVNCGYYGKGAKTTKKAIQKWNKKTLIKKWFEIWELFLIKILIKSNIG